MIRRLAILVLAAGLLLHACAPIPPPPARDRRGPLIVVLVVDQLRTDYLERYGSRFTGGLRRIMDEGAWFRNAAYPYLNTVTCAGHSTIGTGVLPYRHGMVLNAWWDREAGRSNPCTRDPQVRNIGYTGTPAGGDSAQALQAPTLAQRLRDGKGRAVAFSLKARSAIGLVGPNPTAVLWFDERHGWTTSTAFTNTPIDWIATHIDANPLEAFRGQTWERLLPESAYLGPDAGVGERTPSGWTQVFPFAVPEAAPFDWNATAARRGQGFNECCYGWCSDKPPGSD
jgi:hypothetical protein